MDPSLMRRVESADPLAIAALSSVPKEQLLGALTSVERALGKDALLATPRCSLPIKVFLLECLDRCFASKKEQATDSAFVSSLLDLVIKIFLYGNYIEFKRDEITQVYGLLASCINSGNDQMIDPALRSLFVLPETDIHFGENIQPVLPGVVALVNTRSKWDTLALETLSYIYNPSYMDTEMVCGMLKELLNDQTHISSKYFQLDAILLDMLSVPENHEIVNATGVLKDFLSYCVVEHFASELGRITDFILDYGASSPLYSQAYHAQQNYVYSLYVCELLSGLNSQNNQPSSHVSIELVVENLERALVATDEEKRRNSELRVALHEAVCKYAVNPKVLVLEKSFKSRIQRILNMIE